MTTEPKQIRTDIKTIIADKGLDRRANFSLKKITKNDVKRALAKPAGIYSFEKLLALISPAAEDFLEQMAQAARELTIQRFGKTIKLYAPLYLSNYCSNSCRYCGFNKDNKSKRIRLTIDQAEAEAQIVSQEGFSNILLVSSDDKKFISVDYLTELAARLRNKFSSISIEIYQLTQDEYSKLFKAGIEAVTIYQETYIREDYAYFHPAGSKSDYDNRLQTPDNIAAAKMRQIGLGALLGLTDWRQETLALAEHAHYLMKRYWQSQVSFSFPRLRPACDVQSENFKHLMKDKHLVQMITALRLCFADAGLVLSTRESAELRDHLIKIGITKLSAGSKTNPGGYTGLPDSFGQFEIDDSRTPAQVSEMIKQQGMEPIWKDWDKAFTD